MTAIEESGLLSLPLTFEAVILSSGCAAGMRARPRDSFGEESRIGSRRSHSVDEISYCVSRILYYPNTQPC